LKNYSSFRVYYTDIMTCILDDSPLVLHYEAQSYFEIIDKE